MKSHIKLIWHFSEQKQTSFHSFLLKAFFCSNGNNNKWTYNWKIFVRPLSIRPKCIVTLGFDEIVQQERQSFPSKLTCKYGILVRHFFHLLLLHFERTKESNGFHSFHLHHSFEWAERFLFVTAFKTAHKFIAIAYTFISCNLRVRALLAVDWASVVISATKKKYEIPMNGINTIAVKNPKWLKIGIFVSFLLLQLCVCFLWSRIHRFILFGSVCQMHKYILTTIWSAFHSPERDKIVSVTNTSSFFRMLFFLLLLLLSVRTSVDCVVADFSEFHFQFSIDGVCI